MEILGYGCVIVRIVLLGTWAVYGKNEKNLPWLLCEVLNRGGYLQS